MMANWTAEIMTDPERNHRLHVELLEDGACRARLYKDDAGTLQLQLYDTPTTTIPVQWLLEIAARFTDDLRAVDRGEGK